MPHDIETSATPRSLSEAGAASDPTRSLSEAGEADRDETQRPPQTSNETHSTRFARATAADTDELRALAAGLDALQTDASDRPTAWRRIRQSVLPPILCVIALIAAWQLYIVIAQPRPDIVPAPADVAAAVGTAWETGQLQQAVLTSLERGILGFLIAIIIGTPIGLLLAEVKPLRRAFGPLISGLQVLPSVAWVPAAILWFGLTDATAYFVVLMGATPSVINGLISGIDQVPPQLRRVGQVLGAKKWSLASLIVLPAALPGYVAGLKQGWAFSWRSLMAAEIITTGGTMGFGLGTMLDNSRQLSDIASVLATIIVILVIGILVELVIFAPLERRLLRGRGLLQGEPR